MFRNDNILSKQEERADSVAGTLRRLGSYFRQYKGTLLLVMTFIIVGTAAQVAVPILTGQAVDCYLVPDDPAAIARCWYTDPATVNSAEDRIAGLGGLILVVVGLYITNAVLASRQFFFMSVAGFNVLRDIRARVFAHVHRLSLGFFTKNEAGDVMSRFTNDTDTLQQIMGFGLIQVIQSVLFLFFILLAMISQSFLYSLISFATVPLMFFVTRWLSNQARKAFRKAREEIGSVNANLQENISAVREVQAFNREEENIEQFRVSNDANRTANIRAQAYTSALAPSLEALSYVSIAIVGGVGGFVILGDGVLGGTAVSLGLVITFIGYVQQFNRPVQQIAVLWTNLQSAIAGAERIFGLLDQAPDVIDKENAPVMPTINGDVQFQDVWAEYNVGEPILKGVSIEAKTGETIAIVGPTGAGKTTIINLLPRFWDVTQGAVIIDGHDVRDVTRESLRSQIGIVLQDTFLFSTSVIENIRYGRPSATDEEVMEAAKLARAHDFISKLQDGYETVLGERGAGLSQGQRQLIAIARVALANPRILILDEATSSVDTRTEREIQAALDELLAGRTSFVIAHRLSTIRNADQVLVLEAGKVIEKGTHDSLLAENGFYHNLYMSQFRRQETEETAVPA